MLGCAVKYLTHTMQLTASYQSILGHLVWPEFADLYRHVEIDVALPNSTIQEVRNHWQHRTFLWA